VGPRTGLDDVEKRQILPLPGLELRTLGRSQSLSRQYARQCLQNSHDTLKQKNWSSVRDLLHNNGTAHGGTM
jgi:hypothetical protein